MFRVKLNFTFACLAQLGVLLVCFITWYYFRTVAFLAGPPFGDAYAQTWSYQLFVGAVYLAIALVVLALLLTLEAGLIKLYHHVHASKRKQP